MFSLGACGGPPDDVTLPDVEVSSSRDEQGQLCFVVNARQVGGQALRDCRETEDTDFFEVSNSLTIESNDGGEPQQLSVVLMHHPYRVTDVRQEGHSVPWRQEGDLLLVLGDGFNTTLNRTNSEIRFERAGYEGRCEYTSSRSSCKLDVGG